MFEKPCQFNDNQIKGFYSFLVDFNRIGDRIKLWGRLQRIVKPEKLDSTLPMIGMLR